MYGSHPPCSSCDCFICGEDGIVRSTESADFRIVLCDQHFLATSEQYVLVQNKTGTMVVSFTSLDFGGPDVQRYLDLTAFAKLMLDQDVMIGDNA